MLNIVGALRGEFETSGQSKMILTGLTSQVRKKAESFTCITGVASYAGNHALLKESK
jgi:hypothetical protein